MESISADLSMILDRILDTAADNLRIAKILVQMGLDPNNITYDALLNRLLEIVLATINLDHQPVLQAHEVSRREGLDDESGSRALATSAGAPTASLLEGSCAFEAPARLHLP